VSKFRRFADIAAFSEGWGLYSESLRELLGCYTDPYQKLGAFDFRPGSSPHGILGRDSGVYVQNPLAE
jgi:hypothetical protein